ncbi:MAG: AAA family ATPase [Succinivibrionaceae bacterium]
MSNCQNLVESISTVILDKKFQIKLALSCILAKGHLLIEDLPGMGKTTLAKAISDVLGLSCQRVQFTADMLPGDLLGCNIYNEQTKSFEFHEGPVFTNMLLADEINRGSPRTQSALLEVMAEKQVSLDRVTRKLPEPFFVIATQNPLDQAGTFPLPESQLDRFTMRIQLGFPARAQEIEILKNEHKPKTLEAIITPHKLVELQNTIQTMTVTDPIYNYILNLCEASRNDPTIPNPLSPRAAIALLNAAKAFAFLSDRDYVIPDDIQKIFPFVAEHRLRHGNIATLNSTTFSSRILNKVNPVI